MKNIEELIDMLFSNINNELSSDDMIACVLTRDADMYVKKVKYLASLTADEIKSLIIKNNNNTFDYWAALALHVNRVYDKLDKETQHKYKEIFSVVAGHALRHQNVVNSIFKSVIEHKDVNKDNKFDKFTLDELKAEIKRRTNSFNKKP
ncbi:hypothetical protein [Prevotella corporis]|uniref:hypothetical protein n=1 Tax=Prevotella corporis TaxID=28128 RepID=UPI0023F66F2B|nr:hypothetical protein [Prevotella corporis]